MYRNHEPNIFSIGVAESLKNLYENIAIVIGSESRYLMMAMARELIERYDSKIHIYCNGPQELEFYKKENKEGSFASVNDADQFFKVDPSRKIDESELFERARRFEERTGYTINRMVVSHRHFGRGYLLAGNNHMRSRQSESTTYKQMVDFVCQELEFWENEFSNKNITLCINGGRSTAYMAHACDIAYRALAGSRMQNLHYWAWNEMYETPEFERCWHQLDSVPDADLADAYYGHQVNRNIFKKSFGFMRLLKALIKTTIQVIYWRFRGYEKGKNYYFQDLLMYHYRRWRDHQRLEKIATATLADFENKPFVYFPLHIEPEMALHGISPEYFYQHAAIAAISRDLPVGTFLLVKEHFGAIGRRPDSFYRQVDDLKNVIWLNTWEYGIQCAQKANVVATICGTAGLEALVAGKPVIAFGHHNLYNFLSSVRVVVDERDLQKYLREFLSDQFDSSAIRGDARKLLRAIEVSSFDLRQYDYIDLKNFDEQSVRDACDALEGTLNDPMRTTFASVNRNETISKLA